MFKNLASFWRFSIERQGLLQIVLARFCLNFIAFRNFFGAIMVLCFDGNWGWKKIVLVAWEVWLLVLCIDRNWGWKVELEWLLRPPSPLCLVGQLRVPPSLVTTAKLFSPSRGCLQWGRAIVDCSLSKYFHWYFAGMQTTSPTSIEFSFNRWGHTLRIHL